jgi:hypothetical protein
MIFAVLLITMVGVYLGSKQFFPDSRFYLGMSLRFGGMDRVSAYQVVSGLHREMMNPSLPMPDIVKLFDWGLTLPRVVYPLLSAPFVHILGYKGLAIVPAIFTFGYVIGFHYLLVKRFDRITAFVAVTFVVLSNCVMLYSFGMLTESLSIFWGLLSIAFAFKYLETRNPLLLVAIASVTFLSAFTRQATFIVAGAFLFAWFGALIQKRHRSGWGAIALVNGGVALGLQLFQTAVFPFSQADQFMKATGTESVAGAVLQAPGLLAGVLKKEIYYYLAADIPLLLILILCVVSVSLYLGKTENHLFIGAIAGILVYVVTNGSSTHFRYALPGLVFFALTFSLIIHQALIKNRKLLDQSI